VTVWLDLDGTCNTREVIPGRLLRSDGARGLSDADLDRLRSWGLRTVIDLRGVREAALDGADRIEEVAIRRHVPLLSRTVPPQRVEGGSYALMAEMAGGGVAQALELLVEPDTGPALLHCSAGKDRTGIVVAALLLALGRDRQEVLDDYVLTADRMPRILAVFEDLPSSRANADGVRPDSFACTAEMLSVVLARIDAAGGIAGWLVAHGGAPDLVDRVRAAY
jgi:protein tyrosine/serine phosphatase